MRDLLSSRLGVFLKVRFERAFDGLLNARSLLAFASLCGDFVHVGGRAGRRVGLFEPLGQQRLQLAHVFKAQLQRFEAADGRLTEHIAVESAEREAHVGLGEAQLDAALFELFGEVFQIVGAHGRVVLLGLGEVKRS